MKRKFKKVNVPPCPWHKPSNLSYISFFNDADKRTLKGEAQTQCNICGYWFWPHEFGIDPFAKIMANRIKSLKEGK